MPNNVKNLLSQAILLGKDNITENVWGGKWILEWKGMKAKGKRAVGESWEFSGHRDHPSRIIAAGLKKFSLPELIRKYPRKLLGKKTHDKFGPNAPFLVKLIDAREHLSMQVHPDERYARLHETDSGKFESWIVVASKRNPGMGKIWLGFNGKKAANFTGPAELKKAFFLAVEEANRLGPTKNRSVLKKASKLVLPFLNEIKVKKGDIFELPPGTVHAIGRGVRIFEIQKPSNLTYRIWDWNRPEAMTGKMRWRFRPLHFEKAAAVIDFFRPGLKHLRHGRISRRIGPGGNLIEDVLVQNLRAGYGANQITLKKKGTQVALKSGGKLFVFTVIKGSVNIPAAGKIKSGQSVLVPASLPRLSVRSLSPLTEIFKSYPI